MNQQQYSIQNRSTILEIHNNLQHRRLSQGQTERSASCSNSWVTCPRCNPSLLDINFPRTEGEGGNLMKSDSLVLLSFLFLSLLQEEDADTRNHKRHDARVDWERDIDRK